MSQQTDSDAAGGGGGSLEPIWLGVGSPRPQPRVKQNAMFGHVADAFDEKSIFKIGQQPQDRQRTTTQPAGNDHTKTTTTTTGSSDGVASDSTSTTSSATTAADASGIDGVVTAEHGPPRETALDVVG